jgi:hypothetical protein
MKYLKEYKLFEESPWVNGVYKLEEGYTQEKVSNKIKEVDDIKEMIMDILLPISDLGYNNIYITDNAIDRGPIYKSPTEFTIRVVIYTDKPLKIDEDVKIEFDRMVYYLKSIGINNITVNYVKRNSKLNCSKSYDKFMEEVKEDPEFSVRNLLFISRV